MAFWVSRTLVKWRNVIYVYQPNLALKKYKIRLINKMWKSLKSLKRVWSQTSVFLVMQYLLLRVKNGRMDYFCMWQSLLNEQHACAIRVDTLKHITLIFGVFLADIFHSIMISFQIFKSLCIDSEYKGAKATLTVLVWIVKVAAFNSPVLQLEGRVRSFPKPLSDFYSIHVIWWWFFICTSQEIKIKQVWNVLPWKKFHA